MFFPPPCKILPKPNSIFGLSLFLPIAYAAFDLHRQTPNQRKKKKKEKRRDRETSRYINIQSVNVKTQALEIQHEIVGCA